MATVHGNDGSVEVGSDAVAEINDWSVTTEQATANDHSMNDSWETHLTGKKRWNGSLACRYDASDSTGQGTLIEGAEVTLNLYPEGNSSGKDYYSGAATITQVTHTQTQDDVVSISFNFLGNGAFSRSSVV